MNKDKQIEQLAEDILQEFTSCYIETDQDFLERMIHNAWLNKQSEVVKVICGKVLAAIEEGKNNADAAVKKCGFDSEKLLCSTGDMYCGFIGKAITEVFKKYTEGE